ncbi:MAG TPA: zf-HC2 domain-containing protein [Pyrinomonadaceae bacterium]|nr:zf-HC2 domain-containing protein [Pyrinomonadaceae bacterium]
MSYEQEKKINCPEFEDLLTDYLDRTLDGSTHKAVAAHAMQCPLCHSLLNQVKEAMNACREISAPSRSITRLEARILAMTMPETAMHCDEFESYLTDYMDGFLPATLFHRWERHAVLCNACTDLPGMVVRSIAACYTYKMEELPLPEGLHARILQSTIGTARAAEVKASRTAQIAEWLRGFRVPIAMPQLAPVAMILLFAVMFFTQSVSADGSLSNVYEKGVELAEQTYKQSADAWNGNPTQTLRQEPVSGTNYVNEDKK